MGRSLAGAGSEDPLRRRGSLREGWGSRASRSGENIVSLARSPTTFPRIPTRFMQFHRVSGGAGETGSARATCRAARGGAAARRLFLSTRAGVLLGSSPSLCPYSPNVGEGEFCELRLYGVLRSSPVEGSIPDPADSEARRPANAPVAGPTRPPGGRGTRLPGASCAAGR